jgi:hypothetical protein
VVVRLAPGEGGALPNPLLAPTDPTLDAPAKLAPEPEADPLRARDDLEPERRVLIVIDGAERIVDIDAARAAGYGVVDLTNDWTPYIFASFDGPDGEPLVNRYSQVFVGLANDRTDGDGRPLKGTEKNFLEVFGIPPSSGVVAQRFVDDDGKACHAKIDYALISTLGEMTYRNKRRERSHKRKVRGLSKKIKKAMRKHKVKNYADLENAAPTLANDIAYLEQAELEAAVLAEIDKRLDCDGHSNKRYRHKKGQLDHGLRLALRRFQRKNKIYEHTNLRKKTMKQMGKAPVVTNFEAFQRMFTERIIAATGIIEDGTAQTGKAPPTYTGKDGKTYPIRNLIKEFTTAAKTQLELDTPERTLAFVKRHGVEAFEWMKVGVKFPKLPEYYAEHMDLELVVDRGDVWYEAPFNAAGKAITQSRARMPKLALYLNYNEQRFRIIRWPTTIGGWRDEQAPNGYLYYKYKGSDTGKRVIRKILAGPTWVPPTTTPLRSLAKRKYINGKKQGVVNYAEMGPGYLSAYGLVAGYFVIPGKDPSGDRDVDRGIRAHGSSDYMSILSSRRFSHGCHRLMNHHAVRMYGFLLNHRTKQVIGDQPINHARQFLYNDEAFEIRLPSRGFRYDLTPPLPVTVLSGRIRGKITKPVEGFVPIPGKEYPGVAPEDRPADPEARTGGGSTEPETDTEPDVEEEGL